MSVDKKYDMLIVRALSYSGVRFYTTSLQILVIHSNIEGVPAKDLETAQLFVD